MEQLLQRLFSSELLTESTKAELEAAIKQKIAEAVAEARSAVEKEVRTSLAEQWVTERDTLIRSLDAKVTDFLTAEMAELHEDIERFRDLEAEHAVKLTEARAEMADQLKKDLGELTKTVSNFLEVRLNAEMTELKEDIEEVKKLQFGKKLFEAFENEFTTSHHDADGVMAKLRNTEKRLEEALGTLAERDRKINESERSTKMREVLAPLSGQHRDVMYAIIKNLPTSQLEEGYKTFIGRVLKEHKAPVATESEKEKPVLAEKKEDVKKPVVKTGDVTKPADVKPVLAESVELERLRRLSGI